MAENNGNGLVNKKQTLSILILMFPSLLIAMAASIPQIGLQLFFQVILLFFQFVLIKNFVGDYYGEL